MDEKTLLVFPFVFRAVVIAVFRPVVGSVVGIVGVIGVVLVVVLVVALVVGSVVLVGHSGFTSFKIEASISWDGKPPLEIRS